MDDLQSQGAHPQSDGKPRAGSTSLVVGREYIVTSARGAPSVLADVVAAALLGETRWRWLWLRARHCCGRVGSYGGARAPKQEVTVEITVTGRHIQVSDRFRQTLADKLAKVELYAPHTQRVDVVVSQETTRGTPKGTERIEITCVAKGPVIRAEARADDKYAALDLALDKLAERLRRAGDRRKVQRRRGGPDIQAATAGLDVADLSSGAAESPSQESEGSADLAGDSPIQVREKSHASTPMTLDQALYSMELVGHDFFLFHDRDTDRPSVVYKRRGWEYGVLRLEVQQPAEEG